MAVPIAPWGTPSRLGALATLVGLALSPPALAQETQNPAPPIPDASVTCDVLVVGGGLAGTATAYEALRAGRTVCLTDITDWVGGQISSQGTTALDEVGRQRALLFYAQGYLALRDRIPELYDGDLNPGDCWVSATCFLPADAHQILSELLLSAARIRGGGAEMVSPHRGQGCHL
jgi:glycine/D-amino acid oxidase-like deaminating enzyme